ncbi:hypothetical protein BACCIP111899_02284 [Bacillus rhizoplanae]|uniref:YHYH domain-containing protein n=1 Tax=Bacillus rhizoplanae TaxID=2880966 RepID=A0ABN7ZYG4_9BACI|nr:YHYH domain-containing protein [Bacillus rhizoplanae]CAG9613089.1 hypothetical protein BACCIP111899_02284 [Bacillus rhizoplanae]
MIKKGKSFILAAGIAVLVAPISAYAHPGNTDANGGHTCRTNCEKWGLQYGEYHYHNKKEPSSNSGTTQQAPSQDNSAIEAQKQAEANRKAEEEKQRVAEEQRKAEEAKQKAEMEKGQVEGKTAGEKDFQEGKNNVAEYLNGKSDYYKQAFTEAYTATWSLLEQKKVQFEKGKEQGLAQETMDDSQVSSEFKANFAEGFQAGNKERTEKIKKEQFELGEKAGKELAEKKPINMDKADYVKAYEEGYEKGYKSVKEKVEKEGYTTAFESYDLKVPSKYKKNELLKKWFEEGFKSNKKAAEIREAGYENGTSWTSFFYKRFVPSDYKEYKELYKQAIEKGENK